MTERKTLSKTQTELLEALRRGVDVHYMPYAGRFNPTAYYFRADTMKRCTATVEALITKGYAEYYAQKSHGHKVRAVSTKTG